MAMPPDVEPVHEDERKPPSANPAGQTGGTAVVPPRGAGPRWRGPALVGGAMLLILIVLLALF